MKDAFRKLKIIETLSIELEIQKNDFVSKLRDNVDQGGTSFLSDAWDIFSRSKNEFKGEVNTHSFKIKRKKKFLETNYNTAIATGTYYQKENILFINSEINGFHKIFIFYYIFIIFFYLIFFFGFAFWNDDQTQNLNLFFMIFIIIHGFFMICFPIYLMRRSVKRLKHDLKREFFYLTK